ncbi:signal peptidase I [Paenibacillus oenotherae]|uniref:Signal peptidase I n=1 Tax=Paenibacillus oenotherae TaxID=1435645 RepID=A0ABS7D2U3_9BACL|nr:signal peptidase I [Paenibacillus oenotherae]MBW7474242.1 signal peptidase I [Paenibacillus oenotherae]
MKAWLCLISMIIISLLSGCTGPQAITDTRTSQEIGSIQKMDDNIVIHYSSDGMARKNLEFVDKDIVIVPNYYTDNDLQRGDIIYFRPPTTHADEGDQTANEISRVIALEGERISISSGQIYINGSRLETFYGKLLASGMDAEAFQDLTNIHCDEQCRDTHKEYFDTDMEEFEIPSGSVFVLGDNVLRSLGSLNFGTLPKEQIIGKVTGYLAP